MYGVKRLNMAERDKLTEAVKGALNAWEQWRRGKTLLTEWPPAHTVYAPIEDVIKSLEAYKAVEGRSLFSGYSGVVIVAARMALETLRYADRQEDDKADRATDWLFRILNTRDAPGIYYAPIWGLSVDGDVEIAPGVRVVSFDDLPDSFMKRRIVDRAKKQWNETVWQSQSYYDRPAAAIVRRLNPICYIGDPQTPFDQIDAVQYETRDQLAFLQASATGAPLIACGWFEWEDGALDFNSYENWMYWHVPEVVPRVSVHIAVERESLAGTAGKFGAVQNPWQKVLLRSMNRFVLSQCRHRIADRALDLALAFEIAVGGGSGDHGPASWKVSVRTAQLIGGNVERRLDIRGTLSKLYDVRNQTAHGGDLKPSDEAKFSETITKSVGVYRDMLAAALEFQNTPCWKALELEARSGKIGEGKTPGAL